MGRDSVLTFSSFSPARKVFSTTAPVSMFLSRVLTNAPPLPGLTCWKYRMVNRFPSTRMALPFLNWLVDIMPDNSPSKRLVSIGHKNVPRTRRRRRDIIAYIRAPSVERRGAENIPDRRPVAVGAHPGDDRIDGRRDHRPA